MVLVFFFTNLIFPTTLCSDCLAEQTKSNTKIKYQTQEDSKVDEITNTNIYIFILKEQAL